MAAGAFVAEDGSGMAWVFDVWGTALRGPDGLWQTPAPDVSAGESSRSYRPATPAEAFSLSQVACSAGAADLRGHPSGLQRAIEIAISAHSNQVDKAGAPYILHPLRVMLSLATEEERIVGVLHDVVEDSDWTFDLLRRQGFSDTVVDALKSVTAAGGESYEAFVARAGANPIGRRVKIADLTDNMDMRRLPAPTGRDFERLAKYSRALAYLNQFAPSE